MRLPAPRRRPPIPARNPHKAGKEGGNDALRPRTIGRDMSHGFSGSYARQPDMIVTTATLGGAEDIPFRDAPGTGQKGEVIPMGGWKHWKPVHRRGRPGRVKSASEFTARMRAVRPGRTSLRIPARVHQRKVPEGRSGGGWNSLCPGNCQRRLSAGRLRGGGGRENTVALVNAQWGGPADGNGVAELRIAYVGPVPAAQGTAGPQGPKGDPGPQGEPGPQGKLGRRGPQDRKAPKGQKGDQGPAGPSYTLPAAAAATLGGVKQMAAIADLSAAPHAAGFQQPIGRAPHRGDAGYIVRSEYYGTQPPGDRQGNAPRVCGLLRPAA